MVPRCPICGDQPRHIHAMSGRMLPSSWSGRRCVKPLALAIQFDLLFGGQLEVELKNPAVSVGVQMEQRSGDASRARQTWLATNSGAPRIRLPGLGHLGVAANFDASPIVGIPASAGLLDRGAYGRPQRQHRLLRAPSNFESSEAGSDTLQCILPQVAFHKAPIELRPSRARFSRQVPHRKACDHGAEAPLGTENAREIQRGERVKRMPEKSAVSGKTLLRGNRRPRR